MYWYVFIDDDEWGYILQRGGSALLPKNLNNRLASRWEGIYSGKFSIKIGYITIPDSASPAERSSPQKISKK